MTSISINPTSDEMIPVKLRERVNPASFWMQGLVALWVLVTFVDFPLNELVLYPCALTFVALFVIDANKTLPLAAKCWPLWLVPFMTLASSVWAPSLIEAIRSGAFLILSMLIIVVVAVRLNQREIVRAVLIAGVIAMAIAAPKIGTFETTGGPYGSKNIFAIRMVVILLAALAVAYDRGYRFHWRLAALGAGAVALGFGIVANSATALVFSIAAIGLMTTLWIVWQPITRVRSMAGIVITLVAIIAGAVTIVLLSNPQLNLIGDLLSSLGKDSTFTNRTWIWEAGERIARENFWFGVGAEGFWRPESGVAETLNELDHKPAGTKLSFHNAYIENKVHIGMIGFLMFVWSVTWTLWTVFRAWMRGQGMALSFFLIAALIVWISTFTESYAAGAFDTLNFLFFSAAVTSLAQVYHSGKLRTVYLRPNPEQP